MGFARYGVAGLFGQDWYTAKLRVFALQQKIIVTEVKFAVIKLSSSRSV